jgi:flagellar P-ring protein precursor FlgI
MLLVVMSLAGATNAYAVRVKDLVHVRGVRANHLIGYGLVVGLSGTGDTRRTSFTSQSITSLLRRMGLNIDAQRLDVVNTAAVMVTAELPAFTMPGERLDVVVSAMGDARSIVGGTLLLTPLKGVDGKVYALGQGPISVGGHASGNMMMSRMGMNMSTVGRVPSGALVERSVPAQFVVKDSLELLLHEPDFTTAQRIADAINTTLKIDVALPRNSGAIVVSIPAAVKGKPVEFMSKLEEIQVEPDNFARIVLNERTGTVVVGGKVTLGAAAVAHGNINVSIQPGMLGGGYAPYAPGGTPLNANQQPGAGQDKDELKELAPATTVNQLVQSLNALGASSKDLISILQALKTAGALRGDLIVQ